jgi:cyclopropane fatty-acyl-phospholipid synthase-like methyltransferase
MSAKPFAPAAERNRQPILDVIKTEFRDCSSILEIGSGTGQHAVFFAEAMPWLTWQTSDLAENHDGIRSWIADSRLTNVLEPILLNVETAQDFEGEYDGVFSANTAHIMSMKGVACMYALVARVLVAGGVFCLYGPFNQDGKFSTESNRRFDESLRKQDPAMGIRDLADLDDFAATCMMQRDWLYAMPANNLLAVWHKQDERGEK